MKRIITHLYVILFLFQVGCTSVEDFKILHQVTGPIETDCYLIYGTRSKEAAIIDPGWHIDTLIGCIEENRPDLKYVFTTHGHTDHFYYSPEIKKQFPKVRLCMSRDDYKGIFIIRDRVLKNCGKEWIDNARSDPETREYIDFDNELPRSKLSRYQYRNFFSIDASIGVPAYRQAG